MHPGPSSPGSHRHAAEWRQDCQLRHVQDSDLSIIAGQTLHTNTKVIAADGAWTPATDMAQHTQTFLRTVIRAQVPQIHNVCEVHGEIWCKQWRLWTQVEFEHKDTPWAMLERWPRCVITGYRCPCRSALRDHAVRLYYQCQILQIHLLEHIAVLWRGSKA